MSEYYDISRPGPEQASEQPQGGQGGSGVRAEAGGGWRGSDQDAQGRAAEDRRGDQDHQAEPGDRGQGQQCRHGQAQGAE